MIAFLRSKIKTGYVSLQEISPRALLTLIDFQKYIPIGSILVLISSFFVWIWVPIGGLEGLLFPFRRIALLIGIASLVGWFFRSGRVLSMSGVCGLGLFGFVVLHLAFGGSVFWMLVDQNAQYTTMLGFSAKFISSNFGVEPGFKPILWVASLNDQILTAIYFLRWNGWLCLIGSLFLIFEGFRIGGRQEIRWTAASVGFVLGVLGIAFFNNVVAQYDWAEGRHQMILGNYAEALRSYEKAQQWSPHIGENEQFHLHVGAAYDRMQKPFHPHARFYIADRYAQQDRLEEALVEYSLAEKDSESPSALKEIVKKRIAGTLIAMGLNQYRSGEVSMATETWEKAFEFDNRQIHAAYLIAQGYFDQGRYEQSIAMSKYFLARSANRVLNANIQAKIGDGYWKLNDPENARKAYRASQAFDAHSNFAVFENLGGGLWGN